jgi:hypothetical protein
MIEEYYFLPLETNSNFVKCRTCDAVYSVLCGKRIATKVTSGDHGLGKCTKS